MPRRRQLKYSTPREIRRSLAKVNNMVINNELTPQQANSISTACNVMLSSMRADSPDLGTEFVFNIVPASMTEN